MAGGDSPNLNLEVEDEEAGLKPGRFKLRRFDGDLEAGLKPVVDALGKSWVRYDEAKLVSQTKVLPDLLKQQAMLVKALYDMGIGPGCTLKRSDAKKFVAKTLADHASIASLSQRSSSVFS